MLFILIGRWRADAQPEYVRRARQTYEQHPAGYDGVTIVDRYYAIGERRFFSIADAESGEALMRVVTPYLDLADIEAVPVMRGHDGLEVWLESAAD